MDDSNKDWLNQPHHHPPPTSQSQSPVFTTTHSGFTQSTPSSSFNGHPNWSLSPNFYSQYAWLNQNAMNTAGAANLANNMNALTNRALNTDTNTPANMFSSALPQTPPTHNPNLANLLTQSNVPTVSTAPISTMQSMPAMGSMHAIQSMQSMQNMQNMPNMNPFFPYSFPNQLQQQAPFSPIASMPNSPMNGSSMASSPMLSPATMADQTALRGNAISEQKRPRITYNQEQTNFLENWYNNKNHFISTMERNQIAQTLNVSPNQIRIWFQNRRARERQRKAHSEALAAQATRLSLNGSHSTNESGYNSALMNSTEDSSAGMNMTANQLSFALTPTTSSNHQNQQLMSPALLEMLRPQQQLAIQPTPTSSQSELNSQPNFESQERQE